MKGKVRTAIIGVSQTVDVDIDIDLMDYLDEIEDAGFVPADKFSTIDEAERLISLADEAERTIRASNPALALALRDSIDRCRRQMKIEA